MRTNRLFAFMLLCLCMLSLGNFVLKQTLVERSELLLLPGSSAADKYAATQKKLSGIHMLIYLSSHQVHMYERSLGTVRCYARLQRYPLHIINHERSNSFNCSQKSIYLRKHCVVSEVLSRHNDSIEWLFVLDADTGVVNPSHRLESYINDNVQIVFYERFYNWEIASGNYAVKNTEFARSFLLDWSNYDSALPAFSSFDNGALQIHLLKTLIPEANFEIAICERLWHNCTNWDGYMEYVYCVKSMLGARKYWDGKVLTELQIYRRGHGWVLDSLITMEYWCDRMFMVHGWKSNQLADHNWSLTHIPYGRQCEPHLREPWSYRKTKHVSCVEVQSVLRKQERVLAKHFQRISVWFSYAEAELCWPDCHKFQSSQSRMD